MNEEYNVTTWLQDILNKSKLDIKPLNVNENKDVAMILLSLKNIKINK